MNFNFQQSCFVPGMLAIGSKILDRPKDLEVAIKMGEACYWAYNVTTTGIGPEEFYFSAQDEIINSYEYDGLLDGTYKMNGTYKLRPGNFYFARKEDFTI